MWGVSTGSGQVQAGKQANRSGQDPIRVTDANARKESGWLCWRQHLNGQNDANTTVVHEEIVFVPSYSVH